MVPTKNQKILKIKGEDLVYGNDVVVSIEESGFGTFDVYVKNRDIGKFWVLYCQTQIEAIHIYKSVLAFYGRVSNNINVKRNGKPKI